MPISIIFPTQAVFVFYIFSYEPVKYGEDYAYPKWAEGMGVCMSLASMVWVPAYAIYYLATQPGTFREVGHYRFFATRGSADVISTYSVVHRLYTTYC